MDEAGYAEIECLRQMPVAELRERYRQVFGEESTTAHKSHLVRRIAWRLQVLAEGDLSERARRRALEIANDADLKVQAPSDWLRSKPAVETRPRRKPRREPRLPPAGTVLRRQYRGRTIVVKVLAEGFEYEGEQYRSLSAVARTATGTRWNGLLFFGLAQRAKGD
ncbi:MAG: DUF2924 domain-containing protein [Bryobacteraceae bacterium]